MTKIAKEALIKIPSGVWVLGFVSLLMDVQVRITFACIGFAPIQLRRLIFMLRRCAYKAKGVRVKVDFFGPSDGSMTGFSQFEKRNLA
jgi:hypothetical protein